MSAWMGKVAGCAAAALLLPVLAAGAAFGESTVVVDARNDIEEKHFDEFPNRMRPDIAEGDIIRVKYRHTRKRIIIRVKAREFTLENDPAIAGLLNVWDDPVYFEVHQKRDQSYAGSLRVYYSDDSDNDRYPCAGLRVRLMDEKNVLRVNIPRRCMHWPPWVSVGLYTSSNLNPENTQLFDDPMRVGVGVYEPSSGPAIGPPKGSRVYRGESTPMRPSR